MSKEVKLLCETMGVNRSSFYYWKKRLGDPSPRTKNLIDSIQLFQEYHMRYPSHGYRWLNAKIHLDTGLIMSDPYAHKCCKAELFTDFHVTGEKTVEQEIDEYIAFFNEERPAYSLNYLTPKQYREVHAV